MPYQIRAFSDQPMEFYPLLTLFYSDGKFAVWPCVEVDPTSGEYSVALFDCKGLWDKMTNVSLMFFCHFLHPDRMICIHINPEPPFLLNSICTITLRTAFVNNCFFSKNRKGKHSYSIICN
jgi:hypothetical protein